MKILFSILICLFALTPVLGNQNVVDFEFSSIVNCDLPDGTSPELEALICEQALPFVVDDLLQVEIFLDTVFVGFDEAVPAGFVEQLGTLLINVSIEQIDGPGGVQVAGETISFESFPLNNPEWFFATLANVRIDVDDIISMVAGNDFIDHVARGALQAMGFPVVFREAGLIDGSAYVGDAGGANSVGFAISEFRIESGNPLASFVPLSQSDGGQFLSVFEGTFFDIDENLQEVMLPSFFGLRTYMSRTLRGMYVDLGYSVPGINAPGFIDLDNDGQEDDPLFVNFNDENCLPGDVDGSGTIDLLDVQPFVDLLNMGGFQCEADINNDGIVDLTDVQPFIDVLTGN